VENRLELFNKTYNTLVTAWLAGKLSHGDCTACAVGNICNGSGEWTHAFCSDKHGQAQYWNAPNFGRYVFEKESIELIGRTGYTIPELALVEEAFESSIAHDFFGLARTSKGQYLGLTAVMEVLWDIHGIQDKSLTDLNAAAVAKGVKVAA
jgi:hypothetical protein